MVIDHIAGASPLWFLTGGNRFFVGAAEGFVLTAGLVAGLVYGRRVKRDGLGRACVKVLGRALTLYLVTVALTLILLPLSEWLKLPWAQGVDLHDPLSVVVSILALHRTYHLVDVMSLYTILFLLAPLALVLLDQGKGWWVLGASWLLWGVYQLWPGSAALPWNIEGNYLFNLAAWQVIFFTGLVLGYGRTAMPIPRPRPARRLLIASGAALGALITLFVVMGPAASATQAPATGHSLLSLAQSLFLDKVDVGAGRLLAAAITFTFLFLAVTVFWQPIRRALGWLLLPLGQKALYAYTVHIGLVAAAAIALTSFNHGTTAPQWLNALVQAASVGLVWVLVRFQVLAPTPRSQRLYRLSPALLAVLALVALNLQAAPAVAGSAQPATAATAQPTVSLFGTPIPPSGSAPTAVAAVQNVPAPDIKPADASQALTRVAQWVGKINGTLEEHWFYSSALDREMPYWAYLPPGYDTAGQRYPVIYLLHGLSGQRDEWLSYGMVTEADSEMSQGKLPPMIIIMPEGDTGYWVNNVGGPSWGDYMTQDVIAQVDSTFRTLREPTARAIGGLSMGGFGALSLAFSHPDVFGVVCANSPSLHPEQDGLALLGTGSDYAARDPVSLAASATGLNRLRIWIDDDAQDPCLARAQQIHGILENRNIDHVWQVLPGAHDGQYWTSHVADYLHFYAEALVGQ